MKVNASSRRESAGRDNHRALEGWFTYIQRPTIAERTKPCFSRSNACRSMLVEGRVLHFLFACNHLELMIPC
jgi:hypothetical protein